MSNYPDDIRQYDHCPTSPFYDGDENDCDGSIYCNCGKPLASEDEVFSGECDKCFLHFVESEAEAAAEAAADFCLN